MEASSSHNPPSFLQTSLIWPFQQRAVYAWQSDIVRFDATAIGQYRYDDGRMLKHVKEKEKAQEASHRSTGLVPQVRVLFALNVMILKSPAAGTREIAVLSRLLTPALHELFCLSTNYPLPIVELHPGFSL